MATMEEAGASDGGEAKDAGAVDTGDGKVEKNPLHIGEFDDFLKERANKAVIEAMKSYEPDPEEVTKTFTIEVSEWSSGYNFIYVASVSISRISLIALSFTHLIGNLHASDRDPQLKSECITISRRCFLPVLVNQICDLLMSC
ncbi:hypothetical protein L2E82_08875 [Cichorium intybus]|uniref:Uncharacterized protein n=1 Tax=Cichorium intybus TaxID=13427 RepID=A0ACB9G911_CICIN|nr:hypothetical protein L2E82_08875 [Cichorium intybus]